jgi:agmatinase
MKVPRYSGLATFLKLPALHADLYNSTDYDIAVFGIPYDSAATFRPGARFGPEGVRKASKKLRASGYHPGLGVEPFFKMSVVDAGDAAVTPFSSSEAMLQAYEFAKALHLGGIRNGIRPLVMIGGDHLTPISTLRALKEVRGDGVCLIHFDAHMDTTDEYFGEKYTHGTTFRRAIEAGYLRENCSISVGLRGGWSAETDGIEHRELGFDIITPDDYVDQGHFKSVEQIRERVGQNPVYLTFDIDVLDPAYAPGTGTLEPGGFSSHQALRLLRALKGLCIVGADMVEVAPAYDHMEITQLLGAYVALDLIGLVGYAREGKGVVPDCQ